MSMSKMSSSNTSRKSYFEENSDPVTGVSICIPRVFNNINYRRIKQTFIDLQWGFVERVDVIPMGQFKRAYVHFAPGRWNQRNHYARNALNALKAREEVKIVYDDPWFWKIGISNAEKPAEPPKPKLRPKVEIGKSSPPTRKQNTSNVEEGEVEESKNDKRPPPINTNADTM